jgi:hypothetical protein
VSHVDLLDAYDITHLNGVPVTTPERTALELARFLEPHMGLAVVDAMAHRGQIDLESLALARISTQLVRGKVMRTRSGSRPSAK